MTQEDKPLILVTFDKSIGRRCWTPKQAVELVRHLHGMFGTDTATVTVYQADGAVWSLHPTQYRAGSGKTSPYHWTNHYGAKVLADAELWPVYNDTLRRMSLIEPPEPEGGTTTALQPAGGARFWARAIYAASDGLLEVETFSDDLVNREDGRRSIAEWAAEYIREMGGTELVKTFELDPEKNWEIVFSGQMFSHRSFNGEYEEYDEEMRPDDECKSQELSESFIQGWVDGREQGRIDFTAHEQHAQLGEAVMNLVERSIRIQRANSSQPNWLKWIYKYAEQHGQDDDPDHEIGDLQYALEKAWGMLNAVQQKCLIDQLKEDWADVLEMSPVKIHEPRDEPSQSPAEIKVPRSPVIDGMIQRGEFSPLKSGFRPLRTAEEAQALIGDRIMVHRGTTGFPNWAIRFQSDGILRGWALGHRTWKVVESYADLFQSFKFEDNQYPVGLPGEMTDKEKGLLWSDK